MAGPVTAKPESSGVIDTVSVASWGTPAGCRLVCLPVGFGISLMAVWAYHPDAFEALLRVYNPEDQLPN